MTNEKLQKTYRRWFEKELSFIEFNCLGNSEIIPYSAVKIAVMDASMQNVIGVLPKNTIRLILMS